MDRTVSIALVSALVSFAAAFFVGRATAPASTPADAGTEIADESATDAPDLAEGAAAELDSDALRVKRLEEDIEALRAAVEGRDEQLGTLRDALAAAEMARDDAIQKAKAAGTAAAATPDPDGPRYSLRGLSADLGKVDFEKAGEAIAQMVPKIHELASQLAKGKPDTAMMAEVQQHNAVLIDQALKAKAAGVPGEGINGAFSHPAVQANNIHAALAAAELPLDEDQEVQLSRLADQFVEDDARRAAGLTAKTPALARVIGEVELRNRFYAGVDGMLSDEQRQFLHADDIRDRLRLDMFSGAIQLAEHCGVLNYSEPEALGRKLAENAKSTLGLEGAAAKTAEELADAWARGLPAAFHAYEPDALDRMGILRGAHALAAAKHQLALMDTLLTRLELDEEKAQLLRSTSAVLVPLKRNTPDDG